MIIYKPNGTQLASIEVDDSSFRYRAIMGDNRLTLYFSLPEHLEMPVGSYVTYQAERYTIERPEALKMVHTRLFEYTVTMEAYQSCARRWMFRNPVDGRLQFPLTATPREHLQMFVDNMNRRDTGWEIGECIDAAVRLVSYSDNKCLEALQMIAQAFDTEYEIVGKTVSLHRVEYNRESPLALSYGKGNGFRSGVGRSNSEEPMPVEILYARGGDRNIDPSQYGSRELLLPSGQTLGYDGAKYSDETGYDSLHGRTYVASQDGLSIQRQGTTLSSKAEDVLDCSEIYPSRTGTVTSVVTVDASGNLYDIVDSSIPSSLDYSQHIIGDETMTVIFQTGMLAGREFSVKYHHAADGSKAARRFEIVPQDMDGQMMPGGAYVPEAGDEYIVFHCSMPQAYIRDDATKTGASWTMMREAVRYMYQHEQQEFSFRGELDGIWAKSDWVNIGGKIVLGGYIEFSDERFQPDGVLIRITGIKDYVNYPYSPTIELSNSTVTGGFASQLRQIANEEVATRQSISDTVAFTRRGFNDAKETMAMLERSLIEGFSQSISPVSAQMLQLLVGDESLQYVFIKDSSTTVTPSFVFNPTSKVFTVRFSTSGCSMRHYTVGKKDITGKVHFYQDDFMRAVRNFTSSALTDAGQAYYLYLRADRTDVFAAAEFMLYETPIGMESETGYYHFLVGILNSELDGDRSFAPLYGFTEISGARITTDRVVSRDGNSYLDLAGNSLRLGGSGKYISWNEDGDGDLILHGTMVQSGSGAAVPVSAWCGEWSQTRTYRQGDEVTKTDGDASATYRYIYSSPSAGHNVTDTTYWMPVSVGQDGQDGQDGVVYFLVCETAIKEDSEGVRHPSYLALGQRKRVGGGETEPTTEGTIKYSIDDGPNIVYISAISSYGISHHITVRLYIGDEIADEKTIPVIKDGADGLNGPASPYLGEYSATYAYIGSDVRCDIVRYDGRYWIANRTAGYFSGQTPSAGSQYWTQFGAQYENIATGLLLAESAQIVDLTAKRVRTKDTPDRRIVIENNELTATDENGNVTMSISGDNLPPASQTDQSRAISDHSFSYVEDAPGPYEVMHDISWFRNDIHTLWDDLVVTESNNVLHIPELSFSGTFRFQPDGGGSFSGGWVHAEVTARLIIDGVAVKTATARLDSSGSFLWYYGPLRIGEYTTTLSVGTHTIETDVQWSIDGQANYPATTEIGYGYNLTTLIGSSTMTLDYSDNGVLMRADGFRYGSGATQYVEHKTVNGVMHHTMRSGNRIFEITGSAIRYTNNGGTTWKTLT